MVVLFIISDANCKGGTEHLAFNLLYELNKINGFECRLFSRFRYLGSDPHVLSLSENDFRKWERLNVNPINKITGSAISDAFLRKRIKQIAIKIHADWIVNHTYDLIGAIPTNCAFKTAQIFNWSVNGYEQSLFSLFKSEPLIPRVVKGMVLNNSKLRWHSAMRQFTSLIVLTMSARDEIKKISSNNNIITIPNPLMQHGNSKSISQLDNKNIVFVGRLSPEKGIMRLLRIWQNVSQQITNYTLSIYGEGCGRADMEKYIANNNIKNVRFMGYCNNIESIYTNADLCCVTSDTEGFGLVFIEAMYYGVPCISFDCPVAPKEVIANAGIVIPCFDENMYAHEIVTTLKNKKLMRELQASAILRAQHFYIDKIISKWVSMFNS